MREGWEMKRLGEVCEFQRGLTYSKKDEVEFSKNIVLRSNNIDLETNKLDFSELKYIKDDIEIPKSKKVIKGSLLICTANGSKSHLGKVALIDDNYDYAFGGFMGLIEPNKNLNPKFLYYGLISESYKSFINELSDGVNINNLKFSQLQEFEISVPPLPEQQRIVSILDEAFAAIDQAKANVQKNLNNAKELFQSELNTIFSKKGEGWVEKKLGDVCNEIFAGGDVPKDNFSEFKTEQYNIPVIANAVKDKGLYGYTNICRVKEPSITIAARGSGTGHTEVRYEAFFPIVRLIVLIPDKSQIILEFLKLSIQNLKILRSGSAIPQLTVPMIKSYSLPLPPIDVQKGIIAQVETLHIETQKLESLYQHKLNELEDLMKSILDKAFKGELTTAQTAVLA